MPVSRYEANYSQLKDIVVDIQDELGYQTLSASFGAWYLEAQYGLRKSEIEECLIDGFGDNGIDAYMLNEDNNSLKLFQFKFPDKPANMAKQVTQSDAQKLIQGCRIIMKGTTQKKCSQDFLDMLEAVSDVRVFQIEFEIVSFNEGLSDNAKEDLREYQEELKASSGTEVKIFERAKGNISSLFDKTQHSFNLKKTIPYQTGLAAYNLGKDIESFLCMVSATELVSAIGSDIVSINDENIRLFEGDTRINKGIRETAASDSAKYFYFFNNGITLICDHYDVDATKRTIYADGMSIVNGCQTVTCLYDLAQEGSLRSEVTLLVRIISTKDYGLRADITEFLNSQNAIKDSYLLANYSIIRRLQNDLLEEGFYLDRQYNEYKNKKARGIELPENVIPIELGAALQYYVGLFLENDAALAKRNKGALFKREKANEILARINAKQVAEAWKMHDKVSAILTKYRKLRRNESNTEFSEFMKIPQEDILEKIESYRFLHTADILLMCVVGAMAKIPLYYSLQDEEKIRVAIVMVRDILHNDFPELAPAAATKSTTVFAKIVNSIKQKI